MNNPLIETHPGRWILLVGPRALRTIMLTFLGHPGD
jgi:hypothetical protein